jgi:hypothetical protein
MNVKKKSNFLLRYEIQPEGISISSYPEWQLYLVDKKKVYVSELTKPSEFDEVKKIDPYKLFPGLPKINEKDTTDLQVYYENKFKIKEARYQATVEECEPPNNNLYLSGIYEKDAGLPEFTYWTVYSELSDYEKQILRDLNETAAKTGLTIYAPDAPERKKFFTFGQPDLDNYDSEYNMKKKLIAGIFPELPKITYTKRAFYKTYKMTITKD